MFGIQHYASFVTAILVFQLVPGPGTLAILGATARDGVPAGLGAVFGTLLGDFLFMLAAVLGLATVLAAYPLAFSALRWFGIGYLVWIGITMLRSAARQRKPADGQPMDSRAHFRRALAVSLTNPKVILFFMGFFPLFLQAGARPLTLGLMMAHVTLLSSFYQIGLVLVGNAVTRSLANIQAVRTACTRLAGIAMIGFGIRLALDNR
jgi:threonine/homoserine/homoserine lactone efflux protein